PRWARWAKSASELETLENADYPFPRMSLKLLGTIVQRYRLRSGSPTQAFMGYFELLDEAVDDLLLPALEKVDLTLSRETYADAGLEGGLRLGSVSDFNTLIATSQQAKKPVFALTQQDVGQGGVVWENQEESISAFNQTFDEMALRVEKLTKT
ncbi:MAG: hypothetical protein L0H24_08270, partial [Microlunatus sp.]|nr:hypothetical protein [Microlunatus sp.]